MQRKDFKLPVSDVELLVNILEKIHNLNKSLFDDITYKLNILLSSNSVFLGICSNKKNNSTASIDEKTLTWSSISGAIFIKKKCDKACSNDKKKGEIINDFNGVISCKSQQDHFTSCLQLKYENKKFKEKEKYILSIILPYLHKAINQYHLSYEEFQSFSLTKREREVIRWIILGKRNYSISKILNVSERTVKFHNNNIYKKLRVHSRLEVVEKFNKLHVFLEK